MSMDNISYDILSGGHYFMENTILCYTKHYTEKIKIEKYDPQ